MQLVVGLALLGVVTCGTVLGGMLPLAIAAVGLDPAVTSAPLVASLFDVAGTVFYLEIARWVLGL